MTTERRFAHPVLDAPALGDAPVAVRVLGDEFVIWRDAAGVPRAAPDRCPHRGARLSLGWNLGERVACWYHGIQVDGSGKVCEVPASAPAERHRVVAPHGLEHLEELIGAAATGGGAGAAAATRSSSAAMSRSTPSLRQWSRIACWDSRSMVQPVKARATSRTSPCFSGARMRSSTFIAS